MQEREYRIYDKSSTSIHRGITVPTYLIWTSWDFIAKQLKPAFDNMNTTVNQELDDLISRFQNQKKLMIFR